MYVFVFLCLWILTFGHIMDVCWVLEDLGQALQQHGCLVVAVSYVLRLLEHLIQRCRLHLRERQRDRETERETETERQRDMYIMKGFQTNVLKHMKDVKEMVCRLSSRLTISTAWL